MSPGMSMTTRCSRPQRCRTTSTPTSQSTNQSNQTVFLCGAHSYTERFSSDKHFPRKNSPRESTKYQSQGTRQGRGSIPLYIQLRNTIIIQRCQRVAFSSQKNKRWAGIALKATLRTPHTYKLIPRVHQLFHLQPGIFKCKKSMPDKVKNICQHKTKL